MDSGLLVVALVALPSIGALACLLARFPRTVLWLSIAVVVASGALAVAAIAAVADSGVLSTAGGWLFLDALGAFHLAVMDVVFLASSLYGVAYFRKEIDAGWFSGNVARRYGALWLGSMAAMTLAIVSNNLAIQWVAIEATTLLTAFLICIHLAPASLEATWKYLVMCSVGVAFAFMGLLLLVASAGANRDSGGSALLWTNLVHLGASLDPNMARVGFVFLLVGYGTKVGLAPMHTWLPDAHSQAPAPVSAVFSGFLLNAALYCLARYLPIVEAATGHARWSLNLMQIFGLASVIVAAAFIVLQRDVKRLLAYSSVEHLGIVALGLGLGGAGAFAALFHTLNHSLGKPVAFFAAGRLGQMYGTHDMSHLAGSARRVPGWGVALFAALLALVGAAPFAFFLSELQVAKAAADRGSVLVLVLFLAGIGVAFIGALRHGIAMAWSEPVRAPPSARERVPASEIVLAAAPLAALLVLGVWMPASVRNAIDLAVRTLGGPS